MDYNSLKAEFEKIQQEEFDILQNANKTIEHAMILSAEAGRVADVAHNSEKIIQEINADFKAKTSITNPTDMTFLSVAVALQCLRWLLLNKLTQKQEAGDSSFEKWVKGKYKGTQAQLPTPYRASYEYIIGNPTVPYDAVAGTKIFDVGGSGGLNGNHRYKTLGHDPLLGFVFGTSNILTSTLTNNFFQTFHVMQKGNTVIGKASTSTMFSNVAERVIEEPKALGAAVIKQSLHIATDIYTKEGIPIPFIQLLNDNNADILGKLGLDTGGLLKAGASVKLASLIDSLIATVHGLYYDGSCSLSLYQVRTKRILDTSKIIAEGSNILKTAITKDIHNLDFGGIFYTFENLLKNVNFITEVKREYMSNSFNKIVTGEI